MRSRSVPMCSEVITMRRSEATGACCASRRSTFSSTERKIALISASRATTRSAPSLSALSSAVVAAPIAVRTASAIDTSRRPTS